jgi:hypothetical protein
MARPLRLLIPGASYHVRRRRRLSEAPYRTDQDRRRFLQFLGSSRGAWAGARVFTAHGRAVLRMTEDRAMRGSVERWERISQ